MRSGFTAHFTLANEMIKKFFRKKKAQCWGFGKLTSSDFNALNSKDNKLMLVYYYFLLYYVPFRVSSQ